MSTLQSVEQFTIVFFFLPVFGTSFLKHSIGGRLYNSIFRSSQKIERLK